MSKELVISAASHERRVAILEEGQLVEIYIEREKEFALVGSIYKGKVTRVLPGMQSAFVDIGLDGDAFLYVSDVFENLEDYDHGHGHEHSQAGPAAPPAISVTTRVELLPGETLAHAGGPGEEASPEEHGSHDEQGPDEQIHAADSGRHDEPLAAHEEGNVESEERQPDSNASAPQNFSPHYNPTQNYPSRTGSDRPGQSYGRGNDRGSDRGSGSDRGANRGGDRGGRNDGRRFGRRGGSRGRGGRPQGGPGGGRNLPASKYAPAQGGETRSSDSRGNYDRSGSERGGQPRGFEPRGPGQRGFDNRRPEEPRQSSHSAPASSEEEPILLPGESLAKYRSKPAAAPAVPVMEEEIHEPQPQPEDISPRSASGLPTTGSGGTTVPRRFTGGLPRWLLADAGSEAVPVDESAVADPTEPSADALEPDSVRSETDLSEDQVAALSADFVEAKHEEATADVEAVAISGEADFEEEEEIEEDEEEEIIASEAAEVPGARESESPEAEARRAVSRAEAEAEAAHESAEHVAALGDHPGLEVEHADEAEEPEDELSSEEQEAEESEQQEVEAAEAAGEGNIHAPAPVEEDVILLPGETRAPRAAGSAEAREPFPRDSARIGGNPRSRFQRPFRSGGRDRGGRGGRPDSRGGRPDTRGRDRGGRPGGGPRFERRGPGGPRHDRGHHGHGHSGPSRRPQLISEMLKAGQDVVIQIAKEPLGKKGARITSHVALPGRFLVYMPTVHHTGVSRKIVSAENRSRLRRLVSEAGNSYPGGFIVRTAAGGATDDEIRADIDFLGKTWNEIKQKSEERKAPSLLHRDLNLVERILRDYVSDDFTGIWIDNEEEYSKVVEFVSRFQPKLVNKVKLYTKDTPIFEEFGIQHELDKALRAKVWLKSGGYIVINHTEALVAIDVNTGKFVGKGSTRLEDTIVKTNLEAVKEIVRQIRLRDLGGIIVVDFIDMEERRNREKVLTALQQALEEDKAPSKALGFNEFGLVCITRKRTKQALERVLCQPCPYCTGSGMVKSIPTLCYEIQAEARKMAAAGHEGPNLTVRVNPEIAKALKTRESMLIDELEQTSHKHIIIQSDATLHWEQYDIY